MATVYYTKAQMRSLLKSKADLVGTEDVEITDSTKGWILKAADGTRIRITASNDDSSGMGHELEEVT